MSNNQVIAKQNIKVGGGCPGENAGDFREEDEDEDRYGSLTFTCPNKECKRINRRDPGELLEICKHCKASVRCD